ncbi:MAG: crotonase/enoyl-CoA hydratase family protein [Alphaproteobacteria bacterium]|nr:crotonase/enoyl-CoA hydratase family protein [Alphaproteobacteria bacterium]
MHNNNSTSLVQFYDQLITEFKEEQGVMWCYANPSPRPCFTPQLLNDLIKFLKAIRHKNSADLRSGLHPSVKYLILGSYRPGVFSLGGDLQLFVEAIKARDVDKLRSYMKLSIDVLFGTYTNMDVPLTTIALIRGNALGAGFEGALACDYLVAEKSVQLGFPEVLFNMFPGMGAYSFLSRRISPVLVEKMILSGRIYTAEELFEIGVVDILAEDGEGVAEVGRFIKRHEKNRNTRESLLKIRNRVNPVTLDELLDIGEIWVEAAMSLTTRELKVMDRLIRSQDRMAKSLLNTAKDDIRING